MRLPRSRLSIQQLCLDTPVTVMLETRQQLVEDFASSAFDPDPQPECRC